MGRGQPRTNQLITFHRSSCGRMRARRAMNVNKKVCAILSILLSGDIGLALIPSDVYAVQCCHPILGDMHASNMLKRNAVVSMLIGPNNAICDHGS